MKYGFWIVQGFLLLQYDYKIFFTVLTGVLCLFYLAAIGYKLLTVLVSVAAPGATSPSREEIDALDEEALPVYTVLVPLYREAEIAERVVAACTSFDYPREKLDVVLLLEEDDAETRQVVEGMDLAPCVRALVVPHGSPKTKPRACNHGLAAARGERLVIYDAEDRPEPDQLKKAVAAFGKLPERVICLQAKLNYYNPRQNWLTKWFTLEYTTWFDLFLPGLNRLGVPIPLGGTSNHFKTAALREVGGWDPFNVAEDCDLGMRLHKVGYRTQVLDSTTWEEANSRLGNWVRQRSRWVKGYIQTHLVHTRECLTGPRIAVAVALGAWLAYGLANAGRHLVRWIATGSDAEKRLATEAAVPELVVAAAAGGALLLWGLAKGARRMGLVGNPSFLLTVGGLSVTLLLNPLFWGVGIAWLFLRWPILYELSWYDDSRTQLNYWSVASQTFWVMAIALLAANAVFILIHLLACARRDLKGLVGYALFVPLYWALISVGAWRGFLQLFTRAHHWDKTVHGLADARCEPVPGPTPRPPDVVPAGPRSEAAKPAGEETKT
jgi:cellulose synthase/poly-beta-1,6-N-acetylglucosamine synthase-like glycosyltransferase